MIIKYPNMRDKGTHDNQAPQKRLSGTSTSLILDCAKSRWRKHAHNFNKRCWTRVPGYAVSFNSSFGGYSKEPSWLVMLLRTFEWPSSPHLWEEGRGSQEVSLERSFRELSYEPSFDPLCHLGLLNVFYPRIPRGRGIVTPYVKR